VAVKTVSDAHSSGVTENRLNLEAYLEEGFWDEVFTEKSYYENQTIPHIEPPRGEKGREVGEFDYLAVNLDENVFLYGEVKSSGADLSYAEDQLERADDHFDDWEMIGQTYLERG